MDWAIFGAGFSAGFAVGGVLFKLLCRSVKDIKCFPYRGRGKLVECVAIIKGIKVKNVVCPCYKNKKCTILNDKCEKINQ